MLVEGAHTQFEHPWGRLRDELMMYLNSKQLMGIVMGISTQLRYHKRNFFGINISFQAHPLSYGKVIRPAILHMLAAMRACVEEETLSLNNPSVFTGKHRDGEANVAKGEMVYVLLNIRLRDS